VFECDGGALVEVGGTKGYTWYRDQEDFMDSLLTDVTLNCGSYGKMQLAKFEKPDKETNPDLEEELVPFAKLGSAYLVV
jgi:hypothetical protein